MRTEYTTVSSETAEGALRELGRYAIEQGYASEGYVEALLDRETEFPTGLSVPTAPVNVAIPHADPEYVEESAVVLAIPETPVRFRDMDDPEESVEVGVVMLLLADESEGYTAFLSNLATLFQHPDFAGAAETGDPDRLLALVEEECL